MQTLLKMELELQQQRAVQHREGVSLGGCGQRQRQYMTRCAVACPCVFLCVSVHLWSTCVRARCMCVSAAALKEELQRLQQVWEITCEYVCVRLCVYLCVRTTQ